MNIMLWPGKRLDAEEEQWLRGRVASLQRAVDAQAGDWQGSLKERDSLSRYLPENDHLWSPDALEGGAHIGPWCDFR